MRALCAAQAFVGAARLLLNFACLSYLPLGDALTLIFSEPLFTMGLSLVCSGARVTPCKVVLAALLAAGMVLCIQPPCIFQHYSITSLKAEETSTSDRGDYNLGVAMALGCAVCGSLCNVLIGGVGGAVDSLTLVLQTGLAGVALGVLGCVLTDDGIAWGADVDVFGGAGGSSRILFSLESLTAADWASLLTLSALGVLAYFSMTEALRAVSPTTVSVLRALEIVLAYAAQTLAFGMAPNALSVAGAAVVMVSVVGIAADERINGDSRVSADSQMA